MNFCESGDSACLGAQWRYPDCPRLIGECLFDIFDRETRNPSPWDSESRKIHLEPDSRMLRSDWNFGLLFSSTIIAWLNRFGFVRNGSKMVIINHRAIEFAIVLNVAILMRNDIDF